jgi:hypothetical protein
MKVGYTVSKFDCKLIDFRNQNETDKSFIRKGDPFLCLQNP